MTNTKIKTTDRYINNDPIEWVIISDKTLEAEEIEEIKNYTTSIYFNDISGKYWIYDFKLKSSGHWIENVKIEFDGNIWKFEATIDN